VRRTGRRLVARIDVQRYRFTAMRDSHTTSLVSLGDQRLHGARIAGQQTRCRTAQPNPAIGASR
jgi:hypothetical protein